MTWSKVADWDGDPCYRLEAAFFYTLGRYVHWQVEVAVWRGSPLDRLFARWAHVERSR